MSLLLDALHKAKQEQAQQDDPGQAAVNAAADCVDSDASPATESPAELTLDIDTHESPAAEKPLTENPDADHAQVQTAVSQDQAAGELQSLAQETRTTEAYIERVEQQLAEADAKPAAGHSAAEAAEAAAELSLAPSNTASLKPANIAAAEHQVPESILSDFENDEQQQRKRKLLIGGGTGIVVLLLLVTVIDWNALVGSSSAGSFAQPLPNINLDDEPESVGTSDSPVVQAGSAASPAGNNLQASSSAAPAQPAITASNTPAAVAASPRETIVNGIEPVNQPVTAVVAVPSTEPTIVISKRRSSTRLQSALNEAYQLYSAGRIDEASAAYAAIERSHPANTDALNGLGATALARGEQRLAQRYFYDALAADPNNVYARAALLTTLQKMAPGDREVELKQVIAQNPDNAFANFALGSFYAEQQNWHSAQQAYFEAHRAEPAAAEYSYNLAVALDHLGQAAAALTYYQRTLALAKSGAGTLPLDAVRNRVASLADANSKPIN